MGKIICEICGTVYPDTAECCPICGYSRELGGFSDSPSYSDPDYTGDSYLNTDEFDSGDYNEASGSTQDSGANQPSQQGRRQIFDYDAVNPREQQSRRDYDSYQDVGNDVTLNDYPQDSYDNYDNYYRNQEKPKSHVGLIIFLVILILLLMAVSGFLLFKFILPNLNPTEPTMVETMAVITEAPTTAVTTVPTIPCSSLTMVEDGEVKLTREGQYYLIHAAVTPENTTDSLSYASEDESIATVDQGGKITAVAEGTTNVVLTCGSQTVKVPVTVSYEEETVAAEETAEAAETTDGEETKTPDESAEAAETTDGEETKAPDESAENAETQAEGESNETAEGDGTAEGEGETEETTEPDIELKLKKSDIMLGRQGIGYRLELDCPLDAVKDIEWSSTDLRVATVKDGVVTTVGPGTCQIVAKYGYQEVRCVIRCNF